MVCRSSAGKRRALLERELVHIVLRRWLQRIGVRVRMGQSLSGGFSRRPRVCLLVCFRLPKAIWSILSVIICLSQRLINPCMSKFTLFHGETANGSLNHIEIPNMPQSYFENCGNSRAKIRLPHPGKAAGAKLTHSRHGGGGGGNDVKEQYGTLSKAFWLE